MKKLIRNSNFLLGLGILSIVALAIVVASLSELNLKPAIPFILERDGSGVLQNIYPSMDVNRIFIIIVVLVVIAMFFLLPPEMKKKVLWYVLVLVVVGLLIFRFLDNRAKVAVQPQQEASELAYSSVPTDSMVTPLPDVTPAVFTPPKPSLIQSYLATLVLILVLVGIGYWSYKKFSRKPTPMASLAVIAKAALKEMNEGLDWGDAVRNAYFRLNKAVADWRGIHRPDGMDPDEFVSYLDSAQLPHKEVSRLTELFQQVRYGDKTPTSGEASEAVECLTAILVHCKANK